MVVITNLITTWVYTRYGKEIAEDVVQNLEISLKRYREFLQEGKWKVQRWL